MVAVPKSARANARRRNGVRGALWLIVHARYVGGIATTVKVTSARMPRRAADVESTANNVLGLLDGKLSPTAWPRSRNIWINTRPITVIFHRQSRAFFNGNSPNVFFAQNTSLLICPLRYRGAQVSRPAVRSPLKRWLWRLMIDLSVFLRRSRANAYLVSLSQPAMTTAACTIEESPWADDG